MLQQLYSKNALAILLLEVAQNKIFTKNSRNSQIRFYNFNSDKNVEVERNSM
jgi:hypothetical protein